MRNSDSQRNTLVVSPVTKLAFLAIALLICLAPAARQVFNVRSRHLPEWAMFAWAARGQYRVQYFYEGEQGVAVVDRREVLGLKGEKPSRLQITSEQAIYDEGRRLCRKLGVKELSARVHLSTKNGWQRVSLKEDNVCRRFRESKK